MLLRRFALHMPATLTEAVELLARHGDDASVYAGGTELLLAMKHQILRYGHLVDLKRIPDLARISLDDTEPALVIGALTTHHALEHDPLVRRHLPAYAALSRGIGNVRVRVAGTLGGNLCFAEPHADPPALLAALGARAILVGPGGMRQVPAAEFVRGAFDTARSPDEILTRVTVPLVRGRRIAYERFGHLERPTIGVAAVLTVDGRQTLGEVRVWVGAVGPRPSSADAVAERLAGLPAPAAAGILAEAARRDAESVPVEADLHGDEDYKRHLVQVFVERAVRRALAGAMPS